LNWADIFGKLGKIHRSIVIESFLTILIYSVRAAELHCK